MITVPPSPAHGALAPADPRSHVVDAVDRAANALLVAYPRVVLAVSGGIDSMVLLHAVARAREVAGSSGGRGDDRRASRITVATFDHGTGAAATEASALVRRESQRLGFDVSAGRAQLAGAGEAAWREARWRFLHAERARHRAVVATAHTADDHLETVVMRVLRGAGPRGLAGLLPASGIARPFLSCTRETLTRYAAEHQIAHVEDPSNISRAYLRNRVRHDLLPAVRRVRPQFGEEMLELSRRAAALRADIEAMVGRFVIAPSPGMLRVARAELATYDSAALCVLWPALAARAHITLDRRGTLRLAEFTIAGAHGARIQLSGGAEVIRDNQTFLFRRITRRRASIEPLPLAGVVAFGAWRFRPLESSSQLSAVETDDQAVTSDPWVADLPGDRALTVRSWLPGDRMLHSGLGTARRVKRFFADARIAGPEREGWPVVVADGAEIVWIPGVRRSGAAPDRSGRPVIRYACERFDG